MTRARFLITSILALLGLRVAAKARPEIRGLASTTFRFDEVTNDWRRQRIEAVFDGQKAWTREDMQVRVLHQPAFPKYGYVMLCKKDGNVVPKS